jgi:dienelactone hydrolase
MLGMRQAARIGAILVIVVTASAAGLLLWLWFQHDWTVVLPQPTGKYAVGRTALEWADETRAETLGADRNARRELMIWAWYPAAARAGVAPAAYLPREWEELRQENAGPLTRLLTQRPGTVRPHATADAELAPDQPEYPVLVMGPGLGFLAADYTTLAEELASHGYIVLGVNVTYVSKVVVFSDGRVARSAPALGDAVSLLQLWVADQRFVLDQVARLNAMNHRNRFAGRLDLQRIGLFGHSFGGATALEVCRIDVRCKAGASLDGYPFANTGGRDLQQPFMFIWSEPSNVADPGWQQAVGNARRLTSQLTEGVYQFSIKGAGHLGFTDSAVLWAPLLKRSGSLGSLDGARGLHIAATYVRLFFDRHLRGRDAPALDGAPQAYPEVGVLGPEAKFRPPSR